MRQINSPKSAVARVLVFSLSSVILSACGGDAPGTSATAQIRTSTQSYSLTLAAPTAATDAKPRPAFHLAPVILDEPSDIDHNEPSSSATLAPRQVAISPAFAPLSTRGLTPEVLEQVRDTGSIPEDALADGSAEKPTATSGTVTVYTPAQIRAAYGLPLLPSTTSSLTSAQAAQLGAGQTIYLIDAMDEPRVAAELASFDSKFGLPGCTLVAIAPTATLPLSAARASGCTLSVVYSTASGAMTATEPTYNASWATEIALDVQWAHATAPYARLVLIEAPDSSVTSLAAAVELANQMGPGVVSQSFGGSEGSWTAIFDGNFSAPNMTYLAAAGDTGAGVSWPAVSTHVLAVAGTSLTYLGSGARTERVWTSSGGGMMSAFVPTPAYQELAVPGLASPAHRAVADVTFNADPNTGQYLAFTPLGSNSANWYSAGGTSLATPQWAGLIAVANALRAQLSLPPIGAAQPTLYGLALQSASYASNFLDVTAGADGNCTTCYAGVGYDMPSGLGSPNGQSLLATLSAAPLAVAPVVTAATVSGKVGTALSFSITATANRVLTYSLSGAPSGMSVNANTGLVTWSAPVVGSYSVSAQALEATIGLSGQALIAVTILPASPPQVLGGSINGTALTALSFVPQVIDANVVSLSLAGAPSGMAVNTAGIVTWSSPVAGTYAVTVTARDASTGLSGHGLYTLYIGAAQAPTVPSASLSFPVGKALSYFVSAIGANPLTFSLTGAPAGMTITNSGSLYWSAPMLGTYVVTVTAKDTKTGLTGQGTYTLAVIAPGPTIAASSLTGVAGQPLTGAIAFTDSSAVALTVQVSGIPAGMSFAVSGSATGGDVLSAKWASPVTGSYALQVTVTDNQKLTATATIPVTITAH